MVRSRRLSVWMVMVVVFCWMAGAALTPAQESAPSQKQLDLAALKANRKALVGDSMQLSPDQAKVFWPLYEKYMAKEDKIDKRHAREIKDYAQSYQNLTDEDANRKLDEVIQVNQARLDMQKEFIPKFRAVLPGTLVTRFFQIDNKLHALVQAQIADMVPLANKGGPSQEQ